VNRRRKLILGNWKMQLDAAAALALARQLAETARPVAAQLGVCPSHPHLSAVGAAIGPDCWLGAQDVDSRPPGAVTGAVSAEQLRDLGVRFVLLGHSERRELFAEDDATVAAKLRACLRAGLAPLLCLGERLEERRAGRADSVVLSQLRGALAALPAAALGRLMLAYEPVWSIGTGLNADPSDVQQMHAALRAALRTAWGDLADATCILYGGSVRPENAGAYFRLADVDGALVGGASLRCDQFLAIAESCR
jgi:triosephosphate isomerase